MSVGQELVPRATVREMPFPVICAPDSRSFRVVKRVIDLVVSLLALALLAPLLVCTALAIKVSSPGPIFYRWRIAGKDGKCVTSYKFRTMVDGAESMEHDLRAAGRNEMSDVYFKLCSDPRVTPVGRILRKYSLDEIPTLFSVVVGHLTLVGPRPVRESELLFMKDWHKLRLVVKPGLTGLWQVSGKNRINEFDDIVRLDLTYIRNWTIGQDLAILLKTIGIVTMGKNT